MSTDEQLVEKWELSGLLQDVTNKVSMANLLELATISLLSLSNNEEQELQLQKTSSEAASTVFPILYRGFGKLNFTVDTTQTQTVFFTTPVNLFFNFIPPEVENKDVELCRQTGQVILDFFSKKENIIITSVNVHITTEGYNLVFGII